MADNDTTPINVEDAVRERYTGAAQAQEAALCCPIDYDPQYLKMIPQEVIERDYGCGDPSRYVRKGDTVLDLGSGGGKICFIASQIVGATGKVIGVDMNEEMLDLARRTAPVIAKNTGYANVKFHRGRIQDLELDLDQLAEWLADNPVTTLADIDTLSNKAQLLRDTSPMIPDESVDVVVSNCVLNLVEGGQKYELIEEVFRVLKRGGRIAISDIVSDEPVPEELQNDPELWSGCISGAFQEDEFVAALEAAGFYGIRIDKYDPEPWQTVQGIEFRSVTITAMKGKDGPCFEGKQAVIYRGPWKQVLDDDGHILRRGERTAVCAKTYDIMTRGPYAHDIIGVQPLEPIAREDMQPFDCGRTDPRDPRETKGGDYEATTKSADCCTPDGGCC